MEYDPRRIIRLVFVGIALALLAVACVAIAQGSTMGVPMAICISIILLGVGGTEMAAHAAARRRRAMEVLSFLEQSMQLNLPLPRMFGAMAESEKGRGAFQFAEQMREAKSALESGAPLATALAVLPQIPRRILALIAAGERVGRLPQVLARLMQQRRDAIARGALIPPFYRTYPFVVGAAFISVASMLIVFVMPKFKDIFRDFGAKLPYSTQLLLDTADAVSPWILFVIPVLVVLAMVSMIRYSLWRQLGIVESPGAWIANRLPWVGRVRMHGALGDVLQFAADAIEAGWPAQRAISEAALIPANSHLRQQLDEWNQGIARGQSMADAARDAGLPAILSSMLSTAVTTQDVAEVLRFVGRYFSMRFSRGLALAQAAVVPLFAMTMGAFVAWVALSIVMPMTALVNSISCQAPRHM